MVAVILNDTRDKFCRSSTLRVLLAKRVSMQDDALAEDARADVVKTGMMHELPIAADVDNASGVFIGRFASEASQPPVEERAKDLHSWGLHHELWQLPHRVPH